MILQKPQTCKTSKVNCRLADGRAPNLYTGVISDDSHTIIMSQRRSQIAVYSVKHNPSPLAAGWQELRAGGSMAIWDRHIHSHSLNETATSLLTSVYAGEKRLNDEDLRRYGTAAYPGLRANTVCLLVNVYADGQMTGTAHGSILGDLRPPYTPPLAQRNVDFATHQRIRR